MTIVELLKRDMDDETLCVEAREVLARTLQVIRTEWQFNQLLAALHSASLMGDDWDEDEFLN